MSVESLAPRSRRAVLAAAAGAAAASVVAAIEHPAAVLAGTDGDVVLGARNVAQATTSIVNGSPDAIAVLEASTGEDGVAVRAETESGTAVAARAERGTALDGFAMDGIAINGESPRGTALLATGKVRFSRSGRAVVRAGTRAVTVDLRPMGGLAGSPLCFATVQGYRSGVWVAGVRPNYPRSGRMRIYLNRVISSRVTVAWVVLDPLPLT